MPQAVKVDRAVMLRALLVVLQGVAALFFISDMTTEVLRDGFVIHNALEACATLALIAGVLLGAYEIRDLLRRASEADATLAEATASFSDLVQQRFDEWDLTAAEREVALLVLKGFETAEIATLRQTAAGTVRAQVSRIYEKSGKTSRGQFVASFIDVLIENPVPTAL
jgi:DNA-binding NarL/FixJ family response regulator